MKKFLTLLTIFLIFPIVALAENDPDVATVTATISGNDISVEGTTINTAHAVMCKLYDDQETMLEMYSFEVTNNGTNGTFEGEFSVNGNGTYTVTCANYEGGAIVEDTVEATTAITRYRVTFVDGNNTLSQVNVEAGTTVAQPEDPEKNGFTFAGWYADSTFNVEFDFDDTIDGPTTIYAKFDENQENPPENPPEDPPVAPLELHTKYLTEGGTYSVDFATDDPDNQGPMAAPINENADYLITANGEVTLVATPDEGYTFAGWYEVEEDGNEWVQVRKLSDNATYVFNIEDNLNVAPIFEDHRLFPVHYATNGGEPIEDGSVESGGFLTNPPTPQREGYTFVHWCADDTLNIEFDFNEPITGEVTLYAKWDENEPDPNTGGEEPDPNQPEPEKDTPYEATDGNNSISFNETAGHTFSLVVVDIMDLTDAELLEFSGGTIDRETYEQVEAGLKEALEDEGEVLSVYQILVLDEHDNEIEQGPFNIKLAITPEMEEFDTFKLLYVDFDHNFNVEEEIELSAVNGFLTGTLQHLSNYVLVGAKANTNTTGGTTTNGGTTNTTETPTTNNNEATTTETPKTEEKATETTKPETTKTNNPKTLDSIYIWISVLVISIIGLAIGMFKTKKVFK